jgi:hypothetical protein
MGDRLFSGAQPAPDLRLKRKGPAVSSRAFRVLFQEA